jgi:hypothetical protein
MSPLDWFKKESPLFGLTGLWGGVGSNLVGGIDPPIDAHITWSPNPSGSYSNIGGNTRYIKWTENSTVTIPGSVEVDIMMVAKGGNSGPYNYGGGGGGGGMVYVQSVTLKGGNYPLSYGDNMSFAGYTALNGGDTGATGGWDPSGNIARGKPGGCGGGSGRTGAYINPPNDGGVATQPDKSQPGSPGNPGYTNYGFPGFGPSFPKSAPYGQWCNAGGGCGSGGSNIAGAPGTIQSTNGGDGVDNAITGANVIYGAGGGAPGRHPGPSTADPNSNTRGGGGGRPGSIYLRYTFPA